MYLSRFRVKNYKCLADVDIPLTPIHVLIGPNDAGKTSVLEAMAALYNSSARDLAMLFPGTWDGDELVFDGAQQPRVLLRGEWTALSRSAGGEVREPPKYEFVVQFGGSKKACTVVSESVADVQISHPGYPSSSTLLRHVNVQPGLPIASAGRDTLETVSKLLAPTEIYAFDPRVMRLPVAIDPQAKFRLDRDGFGLPTTLKDIQGDSVNAFVELQTQFCRLFGHFKSIRLPFETGVQRQVLGPVPGASFGVAYNYSAGVGAALKLETRSGRIVGAAQVSDGVMLMLGFLALAHLPEPPNLLLIEEPENGIYPKRLGEVIRLLKEMIGRGEGRPFPQIILTTHSPYVLSFFQPEEVTYLSRDPQKPEAGVRARPLREAPNIRERLAGGEFYLGELWYNLTEEELFGEPAEQGGPGGLRRGED